MDHHTDYFQLITESILRRNLFLLLETPRTRDELKELIKINSQNLSKLIKKLKEANLVIETDRVYKLTEIGRVLVEYFKPFLDTIESIEANEEFWAGHDLSTIPDHFLSRISELKDCNVITEDCTIGTHYHFVEHILSSNYIYGVTSVFDKSWPHMFLNLARRGVPVSTIVTKKVFDIIKKNHSSELEDGLVFENASMFLGEDVKLAFIVTDTFFSLSLVSNNGSYDSQCDLVSTDPSAIKWGTDLFHYYIESSIEIKCTVTPNEWIEPVKVPLKHTRECP